MNGHKGLFHFEWATYSVQQWVFFRLLELVLDINNRPYDWSHFIILTPKTKVWKLAVLSRIHLKQKNELYVVIVYPQQTTYVIMLLATSFTQVRNKRGPSADPWGLQRKQVLEWTQNQGYGFPVHIKK